MIYRAAMTSSMLPSTFTLLKAFLILPCLSMTNVDRSIPQNFFPYMFFSLYTPYAFETFASVSESRGKLSEYFDLNLECESRSSRLTPRTCTPRELSFERESLKAHASAVQPGVSSLG